TRTAWSSRSTMATASQVHRLRANPKSVGARATTQRTIIPTHQRPGRGPGDPASTALSPPRRYARRQRLVVAEPGNRTEAMFTQEWAGWSSRRMWHRRRTAVTGELR